MRHIVNGFAFQHRGVKKSRIRSGVMAPATLEKRSPINHLKNVICNLRFDIQVWLHFAAVSRLGEMVIAKLRTDPCKSSTLYDSAPP